MREYESRGCGRRDKVAALADVLSLATYLAKSNRRAREIKMPGMTLSESEVSGTCDAKQQSAYRQRSQSKARCRLRSSGGGVPSGKQPSTASFGLGFPAKRFYPRRASRLMQTACERPRVDALGNAIKRETLCNSWCHPRPSDSFRRDLFSRRIAGLRTRSRLSDTHMSPKPNME